MNLDRRSGVPLYLQIEERVRLGIAQGVWPVGSLLPPEEELCRVLGVSRGPIRQALGRLVQEGLLVRNRRKGTEVVKAIPAHGLILISPYRAIRVAGLQPVVRVLSQVRRRLPARVAAAWGSSRQGPAVFFDRVFSAGDEPVARASSWLPAARYARLLTMDLTGRAFLDVLAQEFGVVITRIEERMELTVMSPESARLLAVPASGPCLAVSVCQWSGDEPIEYAEFWLDPAKSRFLITGLLAVEAGAGPDRRLRESPRTH
ncbi:MAG: GntR family transcriptional regulator [Armatimonadota bacterium]|nr:GntR family transcriptional regulator [Armatimonadota bacterium]